MSHDRLDVQRLRVAHESTFGTDLTSDVASNFNDIRHKPTQIMRAPMMAPDETAVQAFRKQNNDVIGPKRGECALECYFTGTNQALDATTSPTKTEQSKIFEHVLGGYESDQGSESASGEATTGCVVTGGHGSRFDENTICAMQAGGSGDVLPRLIETVSTDTLVWWPALPSAISNGADVYNAQQCFYDDTNESYLQLLAEARLDRGDIWLLRGGALHDFKLGLARGGLVTWSGSVKGAVYDHDDEITTPQGGGSLGRGTVDGTGPKWGQEGGCHFGPSASSTLALQQCVEIGIDFGAGWIEWPLHSGVAGVGGWDHDRGRIEVTFTFLVDASSGTYEAWNDAFEAETDYGFLFWLGATAGNILAIGGRNGQISKAPEASSWNGLKAQKITLLMKENQNSTDGASPSTAVRASPLVIGCA